MFTAVGFPVKTIALGTLASLLMFAGITVVIVRNREGKEVGRIEVPEGGTISVTPKQPPPVATNKSKQTPVKTGTTPALVQSKQVDIDREMAEWAINNGGGIRVASGPVLTKIADLPKSSFRVALIRLTNLRLTAADTNRLALLTSLASIQPQSCVIAPSALTELASHRTLTDMLFTSCQFEAGALDDLLTLKQLKALGFTNCGMSDDFVARLGALNRLRSLRFFGDRTITDAGLVQLIANSPPPYLRSLDLHGTQVTSIGLNAISKLPHLNVLHLSETKVDDQALRSLQSAVGLSSISLTKTQVTRKGTDWLQQNLGFCMVGINSPEEAPSLYGDAYEATIRKLLSRGFQFTLAPGTGTVKSVRGMESWPEGGAITAVRTGWPENFALADLTELVRLRDIQHVGPDSDTSGPFPAGGLRELVTLENLTSLNTGWVLIGDDEVKQLTSLKKLRSVVMSVESDEAIRIIASLPHLNSVTIGIGSDVTSAALKHLENVATLDYLKIVGGRISRRAIDEFLAKRPDVLVNFEGKDIEPPVKPSSDKVSAAVPSSPVTGVAPSLTPYDLLTSPKYEWSPPQELGIKFAHGLHVSADGLTAYTHVFTNALNNTKFRSALRVQQRRSVDQPFGEPEPLGPDDNLWRGNSPCVTDDNLTLVFQGPGRTDDDGQDIWMSERSSPTEPWPAPVRLEIDRSAIEGITSRSFLVGPCSRDGLKLFLSHVTSFYELSRPARDAKFGPPVKLLGKFPGGGDNSGPAISSDHKVLVFSRLSESGGDYFLWQATRVTLSSPFIEIRPIGPPLDVVAGHPTLSPDGQTLYFESQSKGWFSRRVLKTVSAPGR